MKNLALLIILALPSCLASNIQSLEQGQSVAPAELSGELSTTEGATVDLSENRTNPLLLIFAQETCEVCREETIEFKEAYSTLQEKNLEIITVLVGSLREDALAWKSAENWEDGQEVPWVVGYELRPQLFSQLCPNSGTPCSLLQVPNRGVVLKRSGLLHPEEVLEKIEESEK